MCVFFLTISIPKRTKNNHFLFGISIFVDRFFHRRFFALHFSNTLFHNRRKTNECRVMTTEKRHNFSMHRYINIHTNAIQNGRQEHRLGRRAILKVIKMEKKKWKAEKDGEPKIHLIVFFTFSSSSFVYFGLRTAIWTENDHSFCRHPRPIGTIAIRLMAAVSLFFIFLPHIQFFSSFHRLFCVTSIYRSFCEKCVWRPCVPHRSVSRLLEK